MVKHKEMIKIIGTGSYLPERILTNADLEKMVDTSDEWIVTRTGIKERHIAASNEASSDLAVKAARKAIEKAKIKPEDIDLIIVATVTPDMFFPSTACLVQTQLGINNAAAFDVSAACSGFIYALSIAKQYLETGTSKLALVIAAETLSRITDWQDRNTCVLFGDGAGAAVLKKEEGDSGLLAFYLGADGQYGDLLNMPAGGSRMPATEDTVKQRMHFLKMSGNAIFKVAVQSMIKSSQEVLKKSGLKCEDVNLVIPHQANIRIIEAMAKKVGIPMERVFLNIQKCGNMSSATTAVGLDEAYREGRIKKRNIVELVAFGGGFTWGGCIMRW
ncbi:MAG: beta-ketoacyl-ACP synthase III [bacterium]